MWLSVIEQTDKQTNKVSNKQTNKVSNKQTKKQTNKQSFKQTKTLISLMVKPDSPNI